VNPRSFVAALTVSLMAALAVGCGGASGADPGRGTAGPLRINGSTTVNPVVSEAAELLRAEAGLEILVDTQGGSSGGLTALGEGRVEVAMSSRPVQDRDRERYPDVDFRPARIGVDAVALVVSRDVWTGGVRALGREQIRAIYEGRTLEWSRLGGPDRPVVFFDKEPGRGTWEVFADWLYGDAGRAPLISHPRVGSNEEARNKVGGSPGAISQLSAAWADGETVFALGIETPGGRVVHPTPANLADGSYPLARPLLLVTDGEPGDAARRLLDLLLSPRGQRLVSDHGYVPLARVGAAEGRSSGGGQP